MKNLHLSSKNGFTLIELMVVVLIVSLLVLVSTQIPLFSLSSWRKGADRLRMQRDAHYAILRIQRKLRPAILTTIFLPDDNTLIIDEGRFYIDKEETSNFFNSLVWESGEEKEQIVKGDLGTTFQVAMPNTNLVTITLTLIRENSQITLETAVMPRN